jgi:3-oxoacyl-[acyl-carrier-protein] synthase-1
VGHQVNLLTLGFEHDGRLLRLLTGAMKDLGRSSQFSTLSTLPMYLALPKVPPSNEEFENDEDEETFPRFIPSETPSIEFQRAESLCRRAAALAGWHVPLRLIHTLPSRNTSLFELLKAYLADVEAGHIEHAIIGAVDSLLDDETLDFLMKSGRLKNPVVAAGMIPGEACVLLLVGRIGIPGRLADLKALSFACEHDCYDAGELPPGDTLAHILEELCCSLNWQAEQTPWVMSDQNGEAWRAHEFGSALQRLIGRNKAFQNLHVWLPAVSFGDSGAANAGLAIGCALAAWQRGYAPARFCGIVASSEGAERSGLLLADVVEFREK